MKIAVIGAGIAGLSLARVLTDAGRGVVLFDKGRAAGGRMSTRRKLFDHGAQYFTARDASFAGAVGEWEEAGVVERWPQLDDGETRYRGAPHMASLCEHLAEGLAVRSRRRIVRMVCGADGWELQESGGDWFGPFESVVVAIPAPQAAELLDPVPELAQRVAAVEMEPCWAGMFLFEEPLGESFDGRFVDREGMAWVARREGPQGESWVIHAQPDWDPGDALPDLRAALARVLGRELPVAKYERAHYWRYARTSKPLGEPFAWDSMRGIGVCGDWCIGGRIEAAWLSGRALAHAMVR
ncbi:MAG: NAD(P)/FAD-dependent oxidoreductase [Planctomycetota bacterium]|jgi:predicted NAD/FAD-dependent oxidoreductase